MLVRLLQKPVFFLNFRDAYIQGHYIKFCNKSHRMSTLFISASYSELEHIPATSPFQEGRQSETSPAIIWHGWPWLAAREAVFYVAPAIGS